MKEKINKSGYKAPNFIGFRTTAMDRINLSLIQEELGVLQTSEILRNALKERAKKIRRKKVAA